MTVQADSFGAKAIAGTKCLHCEQTEQRCAFLAGCCETCTHTFGEPGSEVATLCRSCGAVVTYPGGKGRPPTQCATCKKYRRR